jgi:hypothetical protein
MRRRFGSNVNHAVMCFIALLPEHGFSGVVLGHHGFICGSVEHKVEKEDVEEEEQRVTVFFFLIFY